MKQFRFELNENGALLLYRDRPLLCGFSLEIRMPRGFGSTVLPVEVTEDALIYNTEGRDYQEIKLCVKESGGVLALFLDATCAPTWCYQNVSFAATPSVLLHYAFGEAPTHILSHEIQTTQWWLKPEFDIVPSAMTPRTQSILAQVGDLHCHLMPLVSKDFRCEFSADALELSVGVDGMKHIEGPMLSLSVSEDPFEAFRATFREGRELGSIQVLLREERDFPEIFEHFGWCTWDAFYHDVTGEKIYQKLDEFKEKGIRIGWVLIDDGWSQISYADRTLVSFEEDRNKFPEGLAATVSKIKNEYGIPYVGVWHAFNGYWGGIHTDGSCHLSERENLLKTRCGRLLPNAEDEERAFAFFDHWHSYLRSCGVDFVKVDNQSSFSTQLDGLMPSSRGVGNLHTALDRSVAKNFGGALINCMGMNAENILQRPSSPISRNSDDFFPKREGSFTGHIIKNAYNAPLHSCLYHCDYDMFWSDHPTAEISSILRAVSGGPIYVSDEIGRSVKQYADRLVDDNGRIYRADQAAMPTLDCLYVDPEHSSLPLKIWNRYQDGFVLAAFNLLSVEMEGDFSLSQIPCMGGAYLAERFDNGALSLLQGKDLLSFRIPPNGALLFNLYPVKDGTASLGRRDKYLGIATEVEKVVKIQEILEKN